MDLAGILHFLYEILYFITVFGAFLLLAFLRGRQATMNVILGLYLALLITLEFPNYEQLFSGLQSAGTIAAAKVGFFLFITFCTTLLFFRIMPEEFRENKFESFGKKVFLALGATIVIMLFSFHVFPITEILSTGTPLQAVFSPEVYFFWWLLTPLVILYIV